MQLSAADAQLAIHAFRAVSLRLKEVRRTERNAAQKRWARMEEAHAQELDRQRDRTQQQRWRNTRCGCGRCRPRLQQNEQESRLRPLPPRHASSEREKSWPMCRMLSGKLCCEHIIRGQQLRLLSHLGSIVRHPHKWSMRNLTCAVNHHRLKFRGHIFAAPSEEEPGGGSGFTSSWDHPAPLLRILLASFGVY